MKILPAILTFFILAVTTAFTGDGLDTSISKNGSAEAGRLVFMKCRSCHRLNDNAPPLVGPNLDNIFGRMAGTSASYPRYSKALKDSGIVWDEQKLDQWLSDPANFLPGNKMPFAGLRSAQDRADLMAYLRDATVNK